MLMLFLIEINLLPPQYRKLRRTPWPIFLALTLGVALVSIAVFMLVETVAESNQLATELQSKKSLLEATKTAAEELEKVNGQINQLQDWSVQAIKLAQTKIYWSPIIDRFAQMLPPQAWVNSIALSAEGGMRIPCIAAGADFGPFLGFRSRLQESTNFFYHFKEVLGDNATVSKGVGRIGGSTISFEITLPMDTNRFSK